MTHANRVRPDVIHLLLLAAVALAASAPRRASADSRFAPDASGGIVSLSTRCALSVTCPLSRRDYEIYRRAQAGDHDAEFVMGGKLERGDGVRPDRDAAIDWYDRAARAGHIGASVALGRLYRQGAAIHVDLPTLTSTLQRGAAAGNADARRALSELTAGGGPIPRNLQ